MNDPWEKLVKTRDALKSCHADSENSLLAVSALLDITVPYLTLSELLKHLEKSTDAKLSAFHQQVTEFEARYYEKVQQREIFENDFEIRRMDQRNDYYQGGNDWLVNDATPSRIREICMFHRGPVSAMVPH